MNRDTSVSEEFLLYVFGEIRLSTTRIGRSHLRSAVVILRLGKPQFIPLGKDNALPWSIGDVRLVDGRGQIFLISGLGREY